MAARDQQVHPNPQANDDANHDEESAAMIKQSKELSKKKRMTCLAYTFAFAVFLAAIIVVLALTVFKLRTPKFRVRSGSIDAFNMEIIPRPSFNFTMRAELDVKNANFGRYRFENSTIYFFYDGVPVGDAVVPQARAGARSTKKLSVVVNLSSRNVRNATQLERDLGVGVLPISSRSQLRGKVELLKVIKKRRSANMDCNIDINLADEVIRDLQCQ